MTNQGSSERRSRAATAIRGGVLVLVCAAALVASIRHGHGHSIPAIALGWPLLLYVERAAITVAICLIVLTAIVRLTRGELPSELSTSGVKWDEKTASAFVAPEREAREAESAARQALEIVAAAMAPFEALDTNPGADAPAARDREPAASVEPEPPTDHESISEETLSKWREQQNAPWLEQVEAASRQSAIADAVAALPEDQKFVYALARYGGQSIASIAAAMSAPIGVTSRRFEAAQRAVESAAARAWLERIRRLYAAIDAGAGDPVHAVREEAQRMIDAGPTPEDPFVISAQISNALPTDRYARGLARDWRKELVGLNRHKPRGPSVDWSSW